MNFQLNLKPLPLNINECLTFSPVISNLTWKTNKPFSEFGCFFRIHDFTPYITVDSVPHLGYTESKAKKSDLGGCDTKLALLQKWQKDKAHEVSSVISCNTNTAVKIFHADNLVNSLIFLDEKNYKMNIIHIRSRVWMNQVH